MDSRLKPITLPSIPKLREYSNTTILDVLFYTSPIYCQVILKRVGDELNRLTQIFLERNPNFKGKISLVGHSLGSLILFDLLSNQSKKEESKNDVLNQLENESHLKIESIEDILKRLNLSEFNSLLISEKITTNSLVIWILKFKIKR